MIVVSSVVMSVYKRVTTHSCCASTCLYTFGTTYSSVGMSCYSSTMLLKKKKNEFFY